MFFLPGWIISIFTFPGVIVHEISHRFFADLAGVPVYNVCYFRLGNPAGYVVHGDTEKLMQSFLISTGPLLVNTILCAIIGSSAVYPILVLDVNDVSPIFGVLVWLSVSIGMHAFPSNQDMLSFVDVVNKTYRKSFLYFSAKILTMIFKLVNALRFFWIDLLYAIGVMLLIPYILGAV